MMAAHQPMNSAEDPFVDPQAQEWERTYSTFQHLSALTGLFGLPVVPALIMWLVKRDQSPYVDDHGKEALNFQLSIVIYHLIAGVLSTVAIGIVFFPVIWALCIYGIIKASIAANQGRYYRYPACLRLIR
jgi:uncharacterized Tic20 family protein